MRPGSIIIQKQLGIARTIWPPCKKTISEYLQSRSSQGRISRAQLHYYAMFAVLMPCNCVALEAATLLWYSVGISPNRPQTEDLLQRKRKIGQNHCQKYRGQHISDLEGLRPDQIDADTCDQNIADIG